MDLVQRTILRNQYDILAKLTDDPKEKKEYETTALIFHEGYEGLYHKGLVHKETFSAADYKETGEILNMFLHIIRSEKPKDVSDEDFEKIQFEGFYANSEKEGHYAIASFITREMGAYPNTFGKLPFEKLNSHSSHSINKYRSMLRVFKDVKGLDKATPEAIKAYIEAVS